MEPSNRIGSEGQALPAGAMSALRLATAACHRRLERRLAINERFSNVPAYRRHLERMLGFHAPLEQRLTECRFESVLADFESRRKVPLLVADLEALGVSVGSVQALPLCAAVPSCSEVSSAFGVLYVFEGATLGGQTLLPFVERRIGVTADKGARYLASYRAQTAAMWSQFGSIVESWCQDEQQRNLAVAAAVETFQALESWLCEDRA